MICPTCGYSNAEEARFCNQCASPLIKAEPPQIPQPETVKVLPKEDWAYRAGKWWAARSANDKMAIGGGGFVVAIFFIVVAIVSITESSKNKPDYNSLYANSSPSTSSRPPERPAAPMTKESSAKDRLDMAKSMLSGTVTADNIMQAKIYLIDIPTSAPEYKESRELLEKIKAGKIYAPSAFEVENQKVIEAIQGADKSLTFEKVKKNPDRYYAQTWVFTGRILEIQEHSGSTVARVGVGAYNLNAIWVEAPFTTDLLDNNSVFIVGTIKGTKTYTSQAGWEISIPQVQAMAIVKPAEGAKLKALAAKP